MDLIERRREMLMTQPSLPEEYREVEWLGTEAGVPIPYIDMGFYLTDEFEAKIHYYNNKNEAFLFGARKSASASPYCNVNIERTNRGDFTRFDYANKKFTQDADKWPYKLGEFLFTFENRIAALYNISTGESKAIDYSSISFSPYTQQTLLLFAAHTGDQISTGDTEGNLRIYSAKFKIGGKLMRNFIPCVRKSDSKAGMYDTVTKTFYRNSRNPSQADHFVVPS